MAFEYSLDLSRYLSALKLAPSPNADESEAPAGCSLPKCIAHIFTYPPFPHHVPRGDDGHYLYRYIGG